jgi:hypothetical protein
MIIQLVSYKQLLRADRKLNLTAEIINSSTADLILFAGHTLASDLDVSILAKRIENKDISAIIEVKKDKSCPIEETTIHNSLYLLQHGDIRSMYTYQIFAESSQINGKSYVAEHLIQELETRRKFTVANHEVIVIQCGENGILKNIQSEGNRAIFRFQDDDRLNTRFDKVMTSTDIILNPIHSPMGNQGKMLKRREYFSASNRAYFSTANFKDANDIETKSIQYAFINGVELELTNTEKDKRGNYIIRTFTI